MSAFVVEDKTINVVVTKLAIGRDFDWLRRKLKGQGYDLETLEGKTKLANEMFMLNVKGVEARYGEGEAKEFRPLDFTYRCEPNQTTIGAYKALKCWLYQCSEGDIPEEAALYRVMRQVAGDLAEMIVRRLPEYEKSATWN